MTEREGAPLSFCRISAPPQCPPHDSKILYYLNDRLRDVIIFVGFWRSPMPPPPPLTPQYLTILVTVSGERQLSFVGFWRPPPPDATILNYLNDRERGALLLFVRFWRPPMTPPPQTPQYFTILMTEREGAPLSFCRILAPPNAPPPHDSKILYYLNDRDEGRYYVCRILAPPNAPPPPSPNAIILNYLNDRERRAPSSFVGFWRPQ